MGAYILRFNVKGVNIDIYRNGKTWGNSFFKHCYDYGDTILVKKDKVTLTPNSIFEALKDALYYVRCKNEEFEDGEISKREHKNAHEWYDYHSKELETLEDAFYTYLVEDEFDDMFEGVWIKL